MSSEIILSTFVLALIVSFEIYFILWWSGIRFFPKTKRKKLECVVKQNQIPPEIVVLETQRHLLHWKLYFDAMKILSLQIRSKYRKHLVSKENMEKRLSILHTAYTSECQREAVSVDLKNDESSVFTRLFRRSGGFVGNAEAFGYHNDLNRFVYLCHRTPRHTVLIHTTFELCEAYLCPIFTSAKNGIINIVSIGGGAMSDLLGTIAVMQRWKSKSLNFTICDLQSWEPVCKVFKEVVEKTFPRCCVNFVAIDATDAKTASLVPSDAHIYLFSFFMVEMTPFINHFTPFFCAIALKAKKGSAFLSVDNSATAVIDMKSSLVNASCLSQTCFDNECLGTPRARKIAFWDEDLSELSFYVFSMTGFVYLWLKK